MSILDRIILTLYTCIMAVVAVLVVVVSVNGIPVADLMDLPPRCRAALSIRWAAWCCFW